MRYVYKFRCRILRNLGNRPYENMPTSSFTSLTLVTQLRSTVQHAAHHSLPPGYDYVFVPAIIMEQGDAVLVHTGEVEQLLGEDSFSNPCSILKGSFVKMFTPCVTAVIE